jgi:hypothetical protein
MRIPEFTADTSLLTGSNCYRSAEAGLIGSRAAADLVTAQTIPVIPDGLSQPLSIQPAALCFQRGCYWGTKIFCFFSRCYPVTGCWRSPSRYSSTPC